MFSNPKIIVEQFYLEEGMHVADIGAGTGHYALAMSDLVGSTGQIYAVDVQQDLLVRLKNEAIREHKKNIALVAADAEVEGATSIPTHSIDKVLFANVLFQFEHKEGAIKEAKRIMKPAGKVIVIDWADSFNNMGPHKDHLITKDDAVKLFLKNGFTIERELHVGDHHYGLICKLQS